MSRINHLRAAVAAAVLTTLAATACDTASADPEDAAGDTEVFEELTRIYPPTGIPPVPRIYPPTDIPPVPRIYPRRTSTGRRSAQ